MLFHRTDFRRGIEQSPYADKWLTDIMYSVYAGRLSAVGTDQDDPLEKYWKLRRNIMLYDIPERPVEVSGRMLCVFWKRRFVAVSLTCRYGGLVMR